MSNSVGKDSAIIKLIELNVGKSGLTVNCDIKCTGVECNDCPVYKNKETISLATIRATDPQVRQPSHYQVFDGLESIEVISRSMNVSEFRGFCMGNVLKYRLRAGKKSDQANVTKDLAKADFYKELFEKYKSLCYDCW